MGSIQYCPRKALMGVYNSTIFGLYIAHIYTKAATYPRVGVILYVRKVLTKSAIFFCSFPACSSYIHKTLNLKINVIFKVV